MHHCCLVRHSSLDRFLALLLTMAIWSSTGVKACSTQDTFWLTLPHAAYFYMKFLWPRWTGWDINKWRYLTGLLSTGFRFSWNIFLLSWKSPAAELSSVDRFGLFACFSGEVRLRVMRNTNQEINTARTWGKWTLYTVYSYNVLNVHKQFILIPTKEY